MSRRYAGQIGLLLATLVLFGTSFGFVVTFPQEVAGITFNSPEVSCLSQKRTIEGPVVYVDELPADRMANESIRYDGYIAFIGTGKVETLFSATGDWTPYSWKRRGVLGVVIVNSVTPEGGGGESLLPGWSVCNDMAPAMLYEVGYPVGRNMSKLLAAFGRVTIKLEIGDRNVWREVRRSWFPYVWRICFTLVSGITSALSLAKMIAYVRYYGPQLSVPQFCLSITFVIALFRTIYHALDPIFFGFVFTASEAHGFSTITLPADLINTLLVALYWRELLHRNKLDVSQFLSKFRWVFWAISFLAVGLEITATVFRAIGGTLGIFTTIAAVVYAVVSVVMTALFFYNGLKVLQYLKQSDAKANIHQSRQRAKATLRRASILIVTSGVFNLVWVAGLGMAAVSSFFWDAVGQHIAWTTVWVGVSGAALAQVLAFRVPKKSSSFTAMSGGSLGSSRVGNSGSGSRDQSTLLTTTHSPDSSRRTDEISPNSQV